MLGEEAAAILKKWNYPFETLKYWNPDCDHFCNDIAVEASLADAMILVYAIVEWHMGSYGAGVVARKGRKDPKVLLTAPRASVHPRIRPVVSPDGRYIFAPFINGLMIIDVIQERYAGLKMEDVPKPVPEYVDYPTASKDTFYLYDAGKQYSVDLGDRLNWHNCAGEVVDIDSCFEPYSSACLTTAEFLDRQRK